jgi:excisionase family DNA binding protein
VVATTPVTVEQAAAILGISSSTVRRRIRDGTIRAEEARRPQGVVRLVYLPDDADVDTTPPASAASAVTTTPVTTPGDTMIAYTQTLLEPLVAALERSEARARQQAETIGTLRAELAAARAQTATVEAPTSTEPSDLTTEAPQPWWRRWLGAVYG